MFVRFMIKNPVAFQFNITGEGADMIALVKSLKDVLPYEIKSYVPDEIGVRDPSLSAILITSQRSIM